MSTVSRDSNSEGIDSPAVRRAGRDPLSLALMDARNRTLQLMLPFEEALGAGADEREWARHPYIERPLWVAGHIAWLAEYWIGRNPQRGLGRACPADAMRLSLAGRQSHLPGRPPSVRRLTDVRAKIAQRRLSLAG